MSLRSSVLLSLAVLLLGLHAPPAHGGLLQSFQATGNLGLYTDAVSDVQLTSITGSFDLSQLPIGAGINRAFLYTGDWVTSTLQLTINNTAVPGLPTTASDTPIGSFIFPTLTSSRWDVTTTLATLPPVPFNFNITSSNQQSQLQAAALFIVWSDPSAPFSTVTIVDGAQQVGERTQFTPPTADTESITFNSLPGGPTALSNFTISDDPFGTGETVRYNGGTDHGPLDGNVGTVASLLKFNDNSMAGNNSLAITSSNDWFGWLASGSVVTPNAVVPEPGSLTLMTLGALGLMGIRWRRVR